MADEQRIQTYAEFWPYYLSEHAHPTCRTLHYIGTVLGFVPLYLGFTVSPWWFIGWPLCGYGFAWAAHFFVEHNKPATFKYPLWSLISDYRMLWQWMSGTLGRDLKRAGIQ